MNNLIKKTNTYSLIVHNDHFNKFEYVVKCLVEICNHSIEQAEQCTYLIHFKGECQVKKGYYKDLFNYHKKLIFYGITCNIVDLYNT